MDAFPEFDLQLLQRYDGFGPRYTSYPTAPQFTTAFGEQQYREAAQRSAAAPGPRPLSVYVHVPFCTSPCFYCGCNRVITRDTGRAHAYVQRLLVEIDRTGELFDARPVTQLHFGGGTPHFLAACQLEQLLAELDRRLQLDRGPGRDYSIEVDPRFINRDTIAELAGMGFNRVSLGVQDFDPLVQRAVNRLQSVSQTQDVIDACRDSGIASINVDLIYGLPRQSLAGFAQTLRSVLAARPDRLAVYGYAHMPGLFKAQRQIRAEDLPSPQLKLQLLGLAVEALSGAGYRHIGMDHFALPTDELALAQEAGTLHRNFMGYTTHAGCDLLGLGVSAISHVDASFSQNQRDLAAWGAALDSGRLPIWRGLRLSTDDMLRGEVIQQLMCQGALDVAALEQRHAIRFEDYFHEALPRLRQLEVDGLVTLTATRLSATPRGRYLLRVIAACFDNYLQASQPGAGTPRYSRVV
jgi:oxygen-independent coproporphyrinogen-3 oxidase